MACAHALPGDAVLYVSAGNCMPVTPHFGAMAGLANHDTAL